jgi:glycosyltransferase involved in cell wall biosynthesis
MRILHITSVIDGRNNSGTARVAYEIISELNQRVGITQTFLHFDLSDSDIYKLPGTTEVLLKPSGKLWGARYLSFFKYALKQNILWRLGKLDKYDVVHWHVSRIYPFFFLLPSSKHILTLHDAGGYLLPNVNTVSTHIFRKVAEKSLKRISSVIVVSASSRRDLIATRKFPPEKIEVLYPATEILSADEAEPLGFNDFVGGSKFLVCVARWQPHKNVESTVRAFAQHLLKENDGLKLILVGKPVRGYSEPQYEITRANLKNDCWVTSDLTDGELKYLYSRAEINVFPSLHEGFGLSVLEGMTLGCPAIVHRGGATEEIAGAGGVATNTTNPFEFAESIKLGLENRSDLSAKAMLRAKYFSWGASVDKLLQIYEK